MATSPVHTVTIRHYVTSVYPPLHSAAVTSKVTFLGGLDVQIYINWLVTAIGMGGACGAYGGGERCAQGSGGETGGKETTGETQT